MQRIFNRNIELEKRRNLREKSTDTEKIIWFKIRDRKLKGYKFKRQYSIGPYIVDFFCAKAKLALEIDGAVHRKTGAIEYDKERDEFIKSLGVKVLRFINDDIENRLEQVLKIIESKLEEAKTGMKGCDKTT